MTRIKLTAGGPKYVSECLRYSCPCCNETLFLHPTRWSVHVEECCENLSTEELSFAYSKADSEYIKELLGYKLLSHHNSTEN